MSDYLIRSYLLRRSLLKNSSRSNRDIYIQKTFNFVSTLIIKSEDLANQLHYWSVRSSPDKYSASTPREHYMYYQQLYGEYTPFDQQMEIYSLDTQEMITYDKNIITHPVTYNRLHSSKTYKKQLIAKYPKQERLINGILHPIHPDVSVNARDWQIIWHDEGAVEPQEILFMDSVQQYIYGFCKRWYISQFLNTEEYALSIHLANLYTSLVNKIMNIRENYLHTRAAHSFHVHEYLISNGVFVDLSYLSMEQKFFLYLNFRYIKKHVGHEKTFKMMIKGLLKPEGIPLVSHINTHRTNSVGNLEPVFLYEDYGKDGLVIDMGVRSLEEYKKLENEYRSVNGKVSSQTMNKQCLSSRYGYNFDKLLVSDMTDTSTEIGLDFNELAFSNLAYLSQAGYISYDVSITMDGILRNLSISDLFIYTLLTDKAIRGIDVPVIPDSVTVSNIVVDGDISKDKYPTIELSDALWKEINDAIPAPQTLPSVTGFYNHIAFLHGVYRDMIIKTRCNENAHERANVLALMALVMQQVTIPLFNAGTSTLDWLSERGLPNPVGFTDLKQVPIISELIYAGTKTVINENHMRLRQSATIETLMSLSSYNISCKYGINNITVEGTEFSYMRILGGQVEEVNPRLDLDFEFSTQYTKGLFQSDKVADLVNNFSLDIPSTTDTYVFDLHTRIHTTGSIWDVDSLEIPIDGLKPNNDSWHQGDINALNSLPQSTLFKIMNT